MREGPEACQNVCLFQLIESIKFKCFLFSLCLTYNKHLQIKFKLWILVVNTKLEFDLRGAMRPHDLWHSPHIPT